MQRSWERGGAGDGDGALDRYAYAYLAGGRQRVVESAITVLAERGLLSLRAARLRTTGEAGSVHAVESAVLAACPRSRRVQAVIDTAGRSGPVDDIARRLVRLGLVSGRRQRTTRAGRRLLAAAVSEGSLPTYVREGHAVLATGPVPHGLLGNHAIPAGLGRSLRRMGKALDDDHGSATGGTGEGVSGGGFGCGGGSGGGD